mmetsp:Transcript_11456/g.44362  ORF Transcript_11456/g.44362 Transcript_11456/m.44362 type:complete len:233 (-) Transcript_11456:1449-2147(-)
MATASFPTTDSTLALVAAEGLPTSISPTRARITCSTVSSADSVGGRPSAAARTRRAPATYSWARSSRGRARSVRNLPSSPAKAIAKEKKSARAPSDGSSPGRRGRVMYSANVGRRTGVAAPDWAGSRVGGSSIASRARTRCATSSKVLTGRGALGLAAASASRCISRSSSNTWGGDEAAAPGAAPGPPLPRALPAPSPSAGADANAGRGSKAVGLAPGLMAWRQAGSRQKRA